MSWNEVFLFPFWLQPGSRLGPACSSRQALAVPNQEKEEREKLILWNSHCNIADKSCSDKLQITIRAYKCSPAPSPAGFEVQSSLMKRCDWKQKKRWNALSSKAGAITHCNKTLQITLLATLLQPLPQHQQHTLSFLTDPTPKKESN